MRGLTAQQKVITASLKASWVLAKHNRPFTDAEVFKEVMVTVLEELATDKSIDGVIVSVKQVSLSARSATRCIEELTLKSQALGQVTELMVDFIKELRANFTSRFEDYSMIPKDIIAFVHNPLTVRPSGDFTSQAKQIIPSLDEASLKMELIDFQTSSRVSDALRSAESVSAFWVACSEEYSTIKRLTFYVLTMFPSTYTCESSFSSMNAIKTHERNRLTHKNLENCLRIEVTSISPDIQKCVTDGRCQFSH
ncbi:SCAN domain containing protein 3 [Dissostichus eleginoides]|uniref:SCAN domain containing protein 3 n=1 Tax=Dissostichus eleginoides TaxID=100907 RepID=A0AAD9B365_DISEL|nr:SCAN domain containing protein 3 [Dissostichus eleginoides]